MIIHYKPRISRNSRLVVDENDSEWATNEKIYCYFLNISMKISVCLALDMHGRLICFQEIRLFFRDAK